MGRASARAGAADRRRSRNWEMVTTRSDVDPCPECGAGKHGNCDGTTWDFSDDERTDCPCAEAGHP